MKPVDRQKMCTNCDGRVSFDAVVCPYCSADLAQAKEAVKSRDVSSQNRAIEASLTSRYSPPYSGKKGLPIEPAPVAAKTSASESKYSIPSHHGGTSVTEEGASGNLTEDKAMKGVLIATFSLSLGGVLFILGLLQAFFAEHGVLRLEWDAENWFVYCLLALPLLYYGYRKASQDTSS